MPTVVRQGCGAEVVHHIIACHLCLVGEISSHHSFLPAAGGIRDERKLLNWSLVSTFAFQGQDAHRNVSGGGPVADILWWHSPQPCGCPIQRPEEHAGVDTGLPEGKWGLTHTVLPPLAPSRDRDQERWLLRTRRRMKMTSPTAQSSLFTTSQWHRCCFHQEYT